jgi:hypothetical protein
MQRYTTLPASVLFGTFYGSIKIISTNPITDAHFYQTLCTFSVKMSGKSVVKVLNSFCLRTFLGDFSFLELCRATLSQPSGHYMYRQFNI